MPNPGNVTPYGDLVHLAALNGGPDQLLNQIAVTNRAVGWHQGFAWGVGGTFAVGLLACGLYNRYNSKKLEAQEAEKQFKEQWYALELQEQKGGLNNE